MMKRYLTVFIMILLCSIAGAQQIVVAPTSQVSNTFAIIVDEATLDACHDEIYAYRDVIEKDGLPTYIISAEWENPEHVRRVVKRLYDENNLEGAVFVGDIPVAMIRGAQHFTSAFKMDQDKFPMFDSSVPSDRFYDDFDLKFKFLCRDSTFHHLFYYWLEGCSPQRISCDIYTGRIRSTRTGEEGFSQIRDYLRKVVKEREEDNPLDRVVSYTGEGSFSNSLDAWKEETVTMQEQVPAAFRDADGAKFYIYAMYDFPKDAMIDEMRRPDVDLMLFHEHGMPERQYLSGIPVAQDADGYYANARYYLRAQMQRLERYGKSTDEARKEWMDKYGIDSTWFDCGPEIAREDSLFDIHTGIVLEDIRAAKPNPRLVIFDACYNGDFRDGDFVAGEYIFGKGRTIACFANSVNVLQDKSATDLMGMLSYGMRLGEWTKNINILESHIIGDPTYRFATPVGHRRIKLDCKDAQYWMKIFSDRQLPSDIQSLALYKLFDLNYEGLSDILYKTYCESPYYTQRLQCMHLLAYYNDANYSRLLKASIEDPYEFIRRKGAYYMGRVGTNDLVPYLVKLYMDDYLSERVRFNIGQSVAFFNTALVRELFEEAVEDSDFIWDKDAFGKEVGRMMESSFSSMAGSAKALVDDLHPGKYRTVYINSMRNNPYPQLAMDAVRLLGDDRQPLSRRIVLAETLGWFVRSHNRQEIIDGCRSILDEQKDMDPALADEILKTVNRLKEYTR